jgi:hypothetical protein
MADPSTSPGLDECLQFPRAHDQCVWVTLIPDSAKECCMPWSMRYSRTHQLRWWQVESNNEVALTQVQTLLCHCCADQHVELPRFELLQPIGLHLQLTKGTSFLGECPDPDSIQYFIAWIGDLPLNIAMYHSMVGCRCVRTRTRMRTHARTHARTRTHTHTRARTHTHMRTNARKHTHTHTPPKEHALCLAVA